MKIHISKIFTGTRDGPIYVLSNNDVSYFIKLKKYNKNVTYLVLKIWFVSIIIVLCFKIKYNL